MSVYWERTFKRTFLVQPGFMHIYQSSIINIVPILYNHESKNYEYIHQLSYMLGLFKEKILIVSQKPFLRSCTVLRDFIAWLGFCMPEE